MLAILAVSIVAQGYTAFMQTEIALDINFDPPGDRSGRDARCPKRSAQADYAR